MLFSGKTIKLYRFERIHKRLKIIDDSDPHVLHKTTKLIYKYYLTQKEKLYFRCLELYYQDKKQREISILLNIDQPNLSAKFSKLRRKLQIIADFLLNVNHAAVFQLDNKINQKSPLTSRQFEILMYLLAGNKAYHISKYLKVSPVAIHQTVTYLKRKLPSDSIPIAFLFKLGSI